MSLTVRGAPPWGFPQGFSKVPLSDEDVLCIVRTLEYDGVVEAAETEDGEVFRPTRARIPDATPLTRFPCGVCPVRAPQGHATHALPLRRLPGAPCKG